MNDVSEVLVLFAAGDSAAAEALGAISALTAAARSSPPAAAARRAWRRPWWAPSG